MIAALASTAPVVDSTTLHSTFARWTRLGLWRRLGQRLARDWRLACGDAVLPSAVVADRRSLRSAPTAWTRGIDGGKLIKGVKLFAIGDKHGSLFELELGPANTDDRTGTRPTLPRLAALGFQGDLLGDSGFTGVLFATAALAELDRTEESQISLTDPDSRAMAAHTHVAGGYNVQIAVDAKYKLIVEQQGRQPSC